MRTRLEIQDIGAVTPLGSSWTETWKGLLAGESRSSASEYGLDVCVSIIENLERSIDADGRGPTARLMHMACEEACRGREPPEKLWAASNHGEADLAALTSSIHPVPLSSETFGASTAIWLSSACSSGLHALWFAYLSAQQGVRQSVVVAGDALSRIGVAGFLNAGATGIELSSPLRQSSAGMRVGEGAVALSLASERASEKPRIIGMAATCDAGHPTHPDASGAWLEKAIRDAIEIAGLAPSDVEAVVAHGTGTRANDTVETEVLTRVFGPQKVPVVSVKGAVGHIMGAAGLLNVAVAAEAWRSGLLPPTLGDGLAWPSVQLTTHGQRIEARKPILATASGFGGNNVAVVVGT